MSSIAGTITQVKQYIREQKGQNLMAAEKEDDFFEQVSKMAERLGLVDEERQQYVHQHMTKAGYTMVPSYIPPEGEEKGSDFFRSARGTKGKSGGSGKSSGWFNE